MRSRVGSGKFIAVAIGALALTATSSARADEDLESLLQQNVVQGASKTNEVANDAPATVSVLTDADIRRYGIRSLDEAIDFLGMGLVTQNPLHAVEVAGRGVQLTADYGSHVLLVIDGHIVNEPWGHTAYFEQGAGIPIELIDHIEILLGPGSILYGRSAMLGVVNVVTKRAARYQGVRAIAEGSLSPAQADGRFTSWAPSDLGSAYRVGVGAGHELTLWGKKLELTAHVERYYQNGPPFTFKPQTVENEDGTPKNFGSRSPLGVWGGTVRNEYDTDVLSGYVKAVVGDFTFMTRAVSYTRTSPTINYISKGFGNFDDARSFERDRYLSFDARYDKQLTPELRLDLHATADSYDYYQETVSDTPSDCSVETIGPCRSTLPGVSRWLGLDGYLDYDWFGDGRLTTLAGAWMQARFVGSKTDSHDLSTGQEMGSVGASSAYELPFAVYAQQRWTPIRRLHFNGGARFDHGERGGESLSPRAAASVDVWQGGSLKTIYSEGFRAPSFYESNFTLGSYFKPNPNLLPEKERSLEASVEQRLGRHTLFFGVFRTWWTNMIQSTIDQVDGVGQFQNVGEIDNYGYNARAEGTVGSFRYGLSVTGAHTRRRYDGGEETPIPAAPSVFGNARVSYELPGSLPVVAVAAKVIGPRLADRALDGNFPVTPAAPTNIQLKVTLTGNIAPVKGLSYRIGIDYSTASHSPYVAGPIQGFDSPDPSNPRAALTPINRFSAFSGLQYEF